MDSVDDASEEAERVRLLQAIEEGLEDIQRGDHIDSFAFIAQLRRPADASDV